MALKPMVPRMRAAATTVPATHATPAATPTQTPAAAAAAAAAATPTVGLVAHDASTGELIPTKKIGEFDKCDVAPREVGALVREAFPAPPPKPPAYSPDEQLQALLEAAEKAVAKNAKQSAKDSAKAILARTQTMPTVCTR